MSTAQLLIDISELVSQTALKLALPTYLLLYEMVNVLFKQKEKDAKVLNSGTCDLFGNGGICRCKQLKRVILDEVGVLIQWIVSLRVEKEGKKKCRNKKGHVKTEAEIGGCAAMGQGAPGAPDVGREVKTKSSFRALGGTWPSQHFDFQSPEL